MLHHQSIDHNTAHIVPCECLNIVRFCNQSVSQVSVIIIAVPAIENLPGCAPVANLHVGMT